MLFNFLFRLFGSTCGNPNHVGSGILWPCERMTNRHGDIWGAARNTFQDQIIAHISAANEGINRDWLVLLDFKAGAPISSETAFYYEYGSSPGYVGFIGVVLWIEVFVRAWQFRRFHPAPFFPYIREMTVF